MIYSATVGHSSKVFSQVVELYVAPGSVIADVTYGQGKFWNKVPWTKYKLLKSDLALNQIDFRSLPYSDQSLDVLVLDPPFMNGGKHGFARMHADYKNELKGHRTILRLYAGGFLEAARVLKSQGKIIVKCQDEMCPSGQKLTHVELTNLLEQLGFGILDLFVMVNPNKVPIRWKTQKSARKNHSYFIVAKLLRN